MPDREALEELPRTSTFGDQQPGRPTLGVGDPMLSYSSPHLLANLLPLANESLSFSAEGVYVGDGIPPVPAKLARRIERGEFVEMGDLLPEFWAGPREDDMEGNRREAKGRKSRKMTEIFTWLQSYASYVSVRTAKAPQLVPELLAYMSTVIRVSQDYSGLAWVRYDAAFRRQAALTGNTRWSVINSTLYTMCFTGMAATTKRCELCFATSHTERECAQRGDPDPEMRERLKAIETAVLAITAKPGLPRPLPTSGAPAKPSGELCRKFNTVGCTFPRCRHNHTCSSCGAKHAAFECPNRQAQDSYRQAGPKHFPTPNRPY